MFSDSHLQEKAADRAMIAAAMAAFYGEGQQAQALAPGETKDLGKRRSRLFVINEKTTIVPQKAVPKVMPRDAIERASKARTATNAKKRAALSVKVAAHAGLGDSVSKTARELGITRVHVRKIAAEHNIKFTTKA